MTSWQTAETAPKDGRKFLVWSHTAKDFEIGHWYTLEHDRYYPVGSNGLFEKRVEQYASGFNCNAFDWWMPLPDAPAAQESNRHE